MTTKRHGARIAILGRAIAPQAMAMAKSAGAEVITTDGYLEGTELEAFMGREQPDAIILRLGKVTDAAMAADPRLKIIAKHGVGYDTIDIAAASKRGVAVTIATGANAISVAEHTLALLLGVARGVAYLDARIRAGHWDKAHFMGSELHGKTIGIVGLGAIGRHLAALCQAFGMQIVVFDPALRPSDALGFVLAGSVDELLATCDFVSLHCPLTDATRSMISTPQLAIMKPRSILINTARGGLVDIEALAIALREGVIGGAGLDTFPKEPPELSQEILGLSNLVVSPHVGASTAEAGERVGIMAMQQVLNYLAGTPIDGHFMVNSVPFDPAGMPLSMRA